MQILKKLQYFFYLLLNWNFPIAWHILLQEFKGEKKYGIDTTGADELKGLEKKGIDTSHATIYMPASYGLLEESFAWLDPLKLKNFVDVGCGRGRAMCVAAHYGFTQLTGIDFSKELCSKATENLTRTQQQFPGMQFRVVNNDAFYFEFPVHTECIFLFNPFDETILSGVVNNLENQFKHSKKDTYIVYLNPLHKNLFLQRGYQEVFYKKSLRFLEASILQKKR